MFSPITKLWALLTGKSDAGAPDEPIIIPQRQTECDRIEAVLKREDETPRPMPLRRPADRPAPKTKDEANRRALVERRAAEQRDEDDRRRRQRDEDDARRRDEARRRDDDTTMMTAAATAAAVTYATPTPAPERDCSPPATQDYGGGSCSSTPDTSTGGGWE